MSLRPKLTHWGRVTYICVSKLTIIGSDYGLSPDRRQAIIWTNAGLLLIGPLGTNFSEISIKILTSFLQENAFESVVFETAAILSQPQCVILYTWEFYWHVPHHWSDIVCMGGGIFYCFIFDDRGLWFLSHLRAHEKLSWALKRDKILINIVIQNLLTVSQLFMFKIFSTFDTHIILGTTMYYVMEFFKCM